MCELKSQSYHMLFNQKEKVLSWYNVDWFWTPFGLQHGRAEPEAAEHPCVLSIMEGLQFL